MSTSRDSTIHREGATRLWQSDALPTGGDVVLSNDGDSTDGDARELICSRNDHREVLET